VIERLHVCTAHFICGGLKSVISEAAPTNIDAAGPNNTAAKTTGRSAIELSARPLRRTLLVSKTAATSASAATAHMFAVSSATTTETAPRAAVIAARIPTYAETDGAPSARVENLLKTDPRSLANLPQTGYKLNLPLVPSKEVFGLAKAALRFVARAYVTGAVKVW
jgi:hypothetical protein